MTKIKTILIAIALSIISVGVIFLHLGQPVRDMSYYAKGILEKCKLVNYHPACYDKEIPKLMDAGLSMEDAFQVTSLVQNEDSSYQFCHVLGHELSAKEYDRNPSLWKEILARCPPGACSNGCLHGGLQEKFRAESLTESQLKDVTPDLMQICEQKPKWNPTGLQQASCYHAIGHLAMYATNADLNKSTDLCKKIAIKNDGRDYTQVCYDGVFMQIYQPLEPEDFALIRGKQPVREDVDALCNKFIKHEKAACHRESWPLFATEIKTPQGLIKFCDKIGGDYFNWCFEGIMYINTAHFNLENDKIKEFCLGMSDDQVGKCFGYASTRLIETDYRNISKAVHLCKLAEEKDIHEDCYQQLIKYSTFDFNPNSPELKQLCDSLDGKWRIKCKEKQNPQSI